MDIYQALQNKKKSLKELHPQTYKIVEKHAKRMGIPVTDEGFAEIIKLMQRIQLQETMGVLNHPELSYKDKFKALDTPAGLTKAGPFQFDKEMLVTSFNRLKNEKLSPGLKKN